MSLSVAQVAPPLLRFYLDSVLLPLVTLVGPNHQATRLANEAAPAVLLLDQPLCLQLRQGLPHCRQTLRVALCQLRFRRQFVPRIKLTRANRLP